jgi:hypothetical protein
MVVVFLRLVWLNAGAKGVTLQEDRPSDQEIWGPGWLFNTDTYGYMV